MGTPEPTPTVDAAIDPEIIDLVDRVRNRHGAHGLRQLIDLATREADDTEDALSQLADVT
jgi:hypothetical protein